MDDTCTHCGGPAARGRSYVRSVLFRQLSWCQTCWEDLHPGLVIPEQRGSSAAERAEQRWFSPTSSS